MTKPRDPNSNRSKRRANRNFTASRPERRSADRLNRAINGFKGTAGERKPGAQKHW
jgi:hypothetical protein